MLPSRPESTNILYRFDLTPCISANDDLKIWVRKEPGGRGEEDEVQRAAELAGQRSSRGPPLQALVKRDDASVALLEAWQSNCAIEG